MKRFLKIPYFAKFLWCASLVVAVGISGCGKPADKPEDGKPAEEQPGDGQAGEKPGEKPTEKGQLTADEILARMVEAYAKASNYADKAELRLLADDGGQPIDVRYPFWIAMEKPNKLRMEAYGVQVVCDGSKLQAAIQDVPDQVVDRPAPKKLTLLSVLIDPILSETLGRSEGGPPPTLALLLSPTPLKYLLRDAGTLKLEQSGEIEGRKCYRVKVSRQSGAAVLWIDEDSYILRRIVYPTEMLRRSQRFTGPVNNISLIADFHGARFDKPVDANAFQFEANEGAKVVKFFMQQNPAGLLGQKVPKFEITTLDGSPITPDNLAGKIAVLDFWATWCGPCRIGLPDLDEVHKKYKDNEKVEFLAVSVDAPQVENADLLKMFEQLGVGVPIVRDKEGTAGAVLEFAGVPTMFVIDEEGVVQVAKMGGDPKLKTTLPAKIDKLLAGQDIFEEELAEHRAQVKEYEDFLTAQSEMTEEEMAVEESEIARTEPAPQSAPETFRLTPAWPKLELTSPGNMLAAPDADGNDRLLVINGLRFVAEVGLDGKEIANHDLGLEREEVIYGLRTAVDGEGNRYFVAMGSMQQRFHLLDAKCNRLLSYPENALEASHAGITDVQLADFSGDGKLEAAVGYWGLVGLQLVSLEGKRIWPNRSVNNLIKLAVTDPDQNKARDICCMDAMGALTMVDAGGAERVKISISGGQLYSIKAADLDGDGRQEWCGLAFTATGKNRAVGFNLAGEELWSYPLPSGVPTTTAEFITVGNVTSKDVGQWIILGPDASIHIISIDGKPVDKFNFGAQISGLTTAEIDGKTLLIIASEQDLKAWFVEK